MTRPGETEFLLFDGDTRLAGLRPLDRNAAEPDVAAILSAFTPAGEETGPALRVSRFATLRRENDVPVLSLPMSAYELALYAPQTSRLGAHILAHDAGPIMVPPALLVPQTASPLAPPAFAPAAVLLAWLLAMGVLKVSRAPAVPFWEWHDLLFHAASRPDRRGGKPRPYRWRGTLEPLPVFKPPMGPLTPLPDTPSPGLSCAEALARRRSGRHFSPMPLSLAELSVFFRMSCAARDWRDDALGGISFRPSPSAGALHGLENYLVLRACDGLVPGLYHYDPQHHGLEALTGVPPEIPGRILEQTRSLCAANMTPAAAIVTTARFARYQWKYAQVAYSLMLKDLGCQHQTMSLAAEALGLASVILGDTPGEPFHNALGLDPLAEGVVGSLALAHRA